MCIWVCEFNHDIMLLCTIHVGIIVCGLAELAHLKALSNVV